MPDHAHVVAVGELLWDLLPGGARLGGTTANFALGCARLGRSAALITSVGEDEYGRRAIEQVRQNAHGLRFDTNLIQTTAEVPTGTVDVVLAPDGHPAYTIVAPVAWDRIHLNQEALAAARHAAALCFGTLAQRDAVSRNTIRQLVEATGPECVRVFDVNARLPFCTEEAVLWSLSHATVVKISEEELELVTGFLNGSGFHLQGQDTPLSELQRAAHLVLDSAPSCQLVALTLGARGSLLVTRTGSDAHPGFPVTVADTVGAGDAFTSGLCHAYLAGAPLPVINEVGNLCGSFVASQPGATPPFPEELRSRIAGLLA